MAKSDDDLIRHLQGITGLQQALLEKILDEIRAWHDEELGAWVQRRHQELRQQGLRNREIYPRLRGEARRALVRPPDLSERQIRRLVYG